MHVRLTIVELKKGTAPFETRCKPLLRFFFPMGTLRGNLDGGLDSEHDQVPAPTIYSVLPRRCAVDIW